MEIKTSELAGAALDWAVAKCGGVMAHRLFEDAHHSKEPTPLIAAMRCYVASKLGDTVDVPEELIHA